MFEVEEMNAVQSFMQSPENAANIEKAGHIVEYRDGPPSSLMQRILSN